MKKNKERTEEMVENHEAYCEICGMVYDINTEADEIAESGTFICADCWGDEENF